MILAIDLHVHTQASDGLHSPREVVRLARECGLGAIAITDHDSVEGIAEAELAAAEGEPPLRILPGVEVSAELDDADVHVLGYLVDYHSEELRAALKRFRSARLERAQEMLARLQELGISLSWERILALADGGAVGRPHVARALVEAGYVFSVAEAFARYLARGQPAYVPRYKVNPPEAVRLIRRAGGVPVLAHPWELQGLVPSLAAAGLEGLEVYYTGYTRQMVWMLRRLAHTHGLICTGGSDFHGHLLKTENPLGGVAVPSGCLRTLMRRKARVALAS